MTIDKAAYSGMNRCDFVAVAAASVTAVSAKSEAAFTELHRLYARRVYSTIFSIMKNHEDPEDVLQETLMRTYLALGSFEGRSKLYSWLTRIAINSSLMALRKRRVRRETRFEPLSCCEDEMPQLQIKDPSPNPEESYLQVERSLRTLNAMAELELPLRTVLQIQMSRECSIREIARSLDLSEASVKSRLHRARRRLANRTQSGTRILPPHTGTAGQVHRNSGGGNEDLYATTCFLAEPHTTQGGSHNALTLTDVMS
jgi:RNA polymerase sigma-70 factor (ECF subfamily)